MSLKVNTKYANYQYAPGIAGYGIDGKSGTAGTNGKTLFICTYSDDENGFNSFASGILQNNDMSTTADGNQIERAYMTGDSFLFITGNIWKITDIDQLKLKASGNQINNKEDVDDCMELICTLQMTSSNDGFNQSENNDFLELDTANYKGFIINGSAIANFNDDSKLAPFNIINGGDDKVEFVSMKSVYAGQADVNLTIYYDTDNKSYHISSDRPILFDCDVRFAENDDIEEFDEYSKPLIKDNTITMTYSLCSKLKYTYSEHKTIENELKYKKVLRGDRVVCYPEYIEYTEDGKLIIENNNTFAIKFMKYENEEYVEYSVDENPLENKHLTVNLLCGNNSENIINLLDVTADNADIITDQQTNSKYINVDIFKELDDETFLLTNEDLKMMLENSDYYRIEVTVKPVNSDDAEFTKYITFRKTSEVNYSVDFIISDTDDVLKNNMDVFKDKFIHISEIKDNMLINEYYVQIDETMIADTEYIEFSIEVGNYNNSEFILSIVDAVEVRLARQI